MEQHLDTTGTPKGATLSLPRIDVPTALALVSCELGRATDLFGPMASEHEGYAVIKEEFEELWDVIKSKPLRFDRDGIVARETSKRKEAVQLAAMAMRFLIDCCTDEA